jgi:hypothetical protein
VASIAAELPWLVPGIAIALVVSIVGSDNLGRWLGIRRSVAWFLLLSLGVILSGTLSPLAGVEAVGDGTARSCDLTRTWLASESEVVNGPDVALNVMLFVPVGFALGTSRLSWRTALVLVLAIAIPFAIELTQLLVASLHRACQSGDIVDNLAGLSVGFIAGAVAALLVPPIRRPIQPEG